MSNVHIPSAILAVIMVIVSCYAYWELMIQNADFGEYNYTIRLIAILFFGLTLILCSGIVAQVYGFTNDDLKKMCDDELKKI